MLYDPNWQKAKPKTPKLRGWQRVLWDAADLIEKKGWINHELATEDGYCIVGAIQTISASRNARGYAYFHLCKAIGPTLSSVADWNDKRGRTKAQVRAKIREVALG
jgi:hypothetical protein